MELHQWQVITIFKELVSLMSYLFSQVVCYKLSHFASTIVQSRLEPKCALFHNVPESQKRSAIISFLNNKHHCKVFFFSQFTIQLVITWPLGTWIIKRKDNSQLPQPLFQKNLWIANWWSRWCVCDAYFVLVNVIIKFSISIISESYKCQGQSNWKHLINCCCTA